MEGEDLNASQDASLLESNASFDVGNPEVHHVVVPADGEFDHIPASVVDDVKVVPDSQDIPQEQEEIYGMPSRSLSRPRFCFKKRDPVEPGGSSTCRQS